MTLQIQLSGLGLALSFGTDDENIRIGPLRIWLGWSMQGFVWGRRFDLICERTGYRPPQGQLVETWQDAPEDRGGYFFGRSWRLLTGVRLTPWIEGAPT